MAKQITDDEDRLKRQARRRLIGAVALTTAIVVVLPMVLDSEPKPAGQNIELRIPDKDKVGVFAPKIDTPPASAPVAALPASSVVAASAPVAAPVVASAPQPVASAPVAVPVRPAAPPVVAPVVPVALPVVVPAVTKLAPPPAKTVVVAAPEHKPEPTKQDIKPVQTKHDAKPAQAKHDAKPTVHTEQGQPVPQSGFVVQIGAFNNADTAHSWQKNLKTQGFKAYTEKLGEKTRVRIGPYSTREAANVVRHKLDKKGLHSNVVELN